MSTVFNISFQHQLIESYTANHGVLVVGKKEHLLNAKEFIEVIRCEVTKQEKDEHFASALEKLSANDYFETCYSKLKIATLPSKGTRHNTPMFSHSLSNIVKSSLTKYDRRTFVIVCERIHAFALGCAVGRVFPLYQQKTSGDKTVDILVEFKFVGDNKSPLISNEIDCLTSAMESIRLTARIVDTPCNQMHTDIFLDEVRKVGKELGIEPMIIQGEDLVPRGFGGIYGVGKAAVHQPALAVLSHKPQGATKNIAWCGKGIVYDTGGLSIKDKVSMPGMKRDCGGAAGILGAFRTAVKLGFKENLHAVLCLAENAVGPKSARPDDVHTLYSGLTVEINNTDAEGRLVLGDGVAYAKKDLNADIILDMATLTGAQGISTGMYHAAVLTNNELWEESCVEAGKMSGDLCFPVPYTPEFHFDEFHSEIADMKNSVKNRSNAQVSCAGLFIGSHIGFDFKGVWMHFDIAATAKKNERATGYGVALLLTLFGHLSENEILKLAAPKNLTS